MTTSSNITAYVERRSRITAHREVGVLEPEPVHAGWSNFVSQRSVRALCSARRSARLWMTTWGGVLSWSRQEERLYRRYSSEHGLAGNAVACMCLDGEDNPWVGHVEGGLCVFDGQRWRVYPHLADEPIRAVAEANRGIWVAGPDTIYHVEGIDVPPLPVARAHRGATSALALLSYADGVLVANA